MSFLQGKGARTSTGALGKSNTSLETSNTTSPEQKVSPGTKRPAGGGKIKGDRGGKKAKTKEIKDEDDEEKEKTITSGGQRPKNSKRRSIASKVSYKEESNSDEEREEEGLSDEEEFQATSEEDSEDSEGEAKSTKGKKGKGKSKANSKNTAAPKRRSDGGKKQVNNEEAKEQEEEEGEGTTSKRTKRRSGKKKEGLGADEWLEVYLEKTSSWVCVDVEHGVGMPHLCSQNATAPVTYVVSVDGDGFVKDLGRKYDPTWLTSSRKRRVDEDWWEEMLEPFLGPEDERDKKEDKEVRQRDM